MELKSSNLSLLPWTVKFLSSFSWKNFSTVWFELNSSCAKKLELESKYGSFAEEKFVFCLLMNVFEALAGRAWQTPECFKGAFLVSESAQSFLTMDADVLCALQWNLRLFSPIYYVGTGFGSHLGLEGGRRGTFWCHCEKVKSARLTPSLGKDPFCLTGEGGA